MSKSKSVLNDDAAHSGPRKNTKAERLLLMLQTGTGASLEEMTEATGWLPHTVRAAMTGLRKRGYEITRRIEGNTAVWSAQAAGSKVPA